MTVVVAINISKNSEIALIVISVVSYKKNFGYIYNIGTLAFNCEGHEDHLSQCTVFRRSGSCSIYRSVGFQCSQLQYHGGIFFTTREENMASNIEYTVFEGINRIEVYGVPPNIDSIIVRDIQEGMIFVGAGKEKDVIMSRADFTNVIKCCRFIVKLFTC